MFYPLNGFHFVIYLVGCCSFVVVVVVVVVVSRFVQHTVTNLTFLDKLIREADDEKKMIASVQYLTKYEKPKLDKFDSLQSRKRII